MNNSNDFESSITFDIGQTVKQYFDDVIFTKEFVIAVDELGVFFFTTSNNENSILIKLSNYLDALDLSKQEIVVCQLEWSALKIGDEVFFNRLPDTRFKSLLFVPVNPDDFEATIRLLLSTRKPVLTEQEIDSIVGCFQQNSTKRGEMYIFLLNRGYTDIAPKNIKDLENLPVITLDDVISICNINGMPAQEIYDAICEYRAIHPYKETDTSLLSRIELSRKSIDKACKRAVRRWILFNIASLLILLFFPNVVLVIFYIVIDCIHMHRLHRVYKSECTSVFSGIAFLCHLAIFIYCFLMILTGHHPSLLGDSTSLLKLLQNLLFVAKGA